MKDIAGTEQRAACSRLSAVADDVPLQMAVLLKRCMSCAYRRE